MAILFIDGFDKFGPTSQATPTVSSLLTAGEWTTVSGSGSVVIAAPLSTNGQALTINSSLSGSLTVSRTLAANYSRLIGGVRFASNLTSDLCVSFYDAGTAQCSVTVNRTTGTISIRTGNITGTALATTGGSVSANSTHYLEWDITFGASAAYQVWLDAVSVLSGTGNTRGTSNNYANQLGLVSGALNSGVLTYDDLYLFDSTGATCNAVLNNNPVVETAFVNADTATKQWSTGAAILGTDNSMTGTTNAPGANQLFLRQYTASQNMTLNSVSCAPNATAGAANFQPVLYGAPSATGAHRYWRVQIFGTGGSNITVAELQFRTVVGTPLLFSGGTASASAGTASSASDNNTGTTWTPGSTTGWWAYDYGLGITTTIAEVAMTIGSSTATAPTNFDLQYSDDAITWNIAANFTAVWSVVNDTKLFQVSSRPTTPLSPGAALVAIGPAVVGATSGTALTAPFSAGQSLTSGTVYAIGFITDTSVSLIQSDAANSGWKIANTYTSGAPATLPSQGTSSTNSWQIWGNCTSPATNYAGINSNPPIDDVSYNWSATTNQEDLYGFPALSNTPASISAVAYKAKVKRSDAGFRTVEVHCASGATDTAGTTAGGVTPGTSYTWIGNYQPTDPNTSTAWTSSGVNAATGGIKVSS